MSTWAGFWAGIDTRLSSRRMMGLPCSYYYCYLPNEYYADDDY